MTNDIIFRAKNHPNVKWNVTKNIMYKEWSPLQKLMKKDKEGDKHWFLPQEFSEDVCNIIMTYKRDIDREYFGLYIKSRKISLKYLREYLLTEYSESHYNDGYGHGNSKLLGKKVIIKDINDMFFWFINRLKVKGWNKGKERVTYHKVSFEKAIKYAEEHQKRYNDILHGIKLDLLNEEKPIVDNVYLLQSKSKVGEFSLEYISQGQRKDSYQINNARARRLPDVTPTYREYKIDYDYGTSFIWTMSKLEFSKQYKVIKKLDKTIHKGIRVSEVGEAVILIDINNETIGDYFS
tara:strand:+ start:150 stop:1028 length:879 start_codon:yes stop_codon:yes gene_type:complete